MAENICPVHSGVCADMKHLKEQTDTNTSEIKTISDAVIRLTILTEEFLKRQPLETTSDTKNSFWDAETKKYVIKWMAVLLIFVIAGLLGANIFEAIKAAALLKGA